MSLPNILGNLFRAPGYVATLVGNVKKQEKFIRDHIEPDLIIARQENDGSLDDSDFKKITSYYGLAVPAILGESLAVLRNQDLTQKERFALTYLGAITGLFDDFFDKFYVDDERIKLLIEEPGKLAGENSAQKLFLHFYKKALENIPDRALVLHYFREVYFAQVESKKQAAPGLTRDEIFDITIKKGGVSVLFYRAALSHPFLDHEEKALFETGGLMQFGNDVYDIYKDRNAQIETLLTTTKKVDEVRQLFKQQMETSFSAVLSTPYALKDKRKFLRLLSLYLCSRCFVFFDQLEAREKQSGNEFRPAEYSREDLVCDMEKTGNKWKTIRYFLRQVIPGPAKLS
jgi:hypothetical protein